MIVEFKRKVQKRKDGYGHFLTIPKAIVDSWKLQQSQELTIEVEEDRLIIRRPKKSEEEKE